MLLLVVWKNWQGDGVLCSLRADSAELWAEPVTTADRAEVVIQLSVGTALELVVHPRNSTQGDTVGYSMRIFQAG